MNSHSPLGCPRPSVARSGAVPPVGVRRSPAAPLAVLALFVIACSLGACASRSLDDMTPEIERDAAGQAKPSVVMLLDYRGDPTKPIAFILANKPGTQLLNKQYRGRLPAGHKEISVERMGQLIAYMRYQGFFDYAGRVARIGRGHDKVRRTLSLQSEAKIALQMEDARGMAQAGRRDEVVTVSEISKAIRHISNQTLSLHVDPTGRTARDFINQPGLKRDTRGKR